MSAANSFCPIQPVSSYCDFRATVDVLRLDLVHPVVSGNKWFKLKLYLEEAKAGNKILVTIGGAYSNHLVAAAATARQQNLIRIGIRRHAETQALSPTLSS